MTTTTTDRTNSDSLLDRAALALRWGVSRETLKRREKDGTLFPIYLPGGRLVRYRLSEILKAEGNRKG
jgi:predicted DNA-binding transcriptional regulator AlpA